MCEVYAGMVGVVFEYARRLLHREYNTPIEIEGYTEVFICQRSKLNDRIKMTTLFLKHVGPTIFLNFTRSDNQNG